jgi:hypothetical protein
VQQPRRKQIEQIADKNRSSASAGPKSEGYFFGRNAVQMIAAQTNTAR